MSAKDSASDTPGGAPCQPPTPDDDVAAAAEERFRHDLLTRGQAAYAVDGQLPPGATHEIVGTDTKGQPILRRRRFSAT